MEFDGVQMLGPPGWVELRVRGEKPPRVLVKFEERDGRGVATRVVLLGDPLDSATLRALPLGRIESVANHPIYGFAGGISKPLDPAVLRELADKGELFPDEVGAVDEGLTGFLQKVDHPDPDYGWEGFEEVSRPPLTRPDGLDPDGFSRQVATAYNDAVLRTSAPAKLLAEEAGVPVTTVHRWVREARQRGHLPPARKGRAG